MNAIPMLVLVIVVLIFVGSTLRQPIQQIRQLRRAARGSMRMLPATGLVWVIGQASGEELRSPLTSTACVLWQVVVEKYRSRRRRGGWTTIFEDKSTQPITLDDGTGQVQVLPAAAELLLSNDLHQARGLISRINPEIEAKLEQLGVQTRGLFGDFGHQLRVSERYILAGEQMAALGNIERNEDQAVLQALPTAPLLLTDQNFDQVLRGFYRRVASTIAVMLLIITSFSCCVLVQVLEPR